MRHNKRPPDRQHRQRRRCAGAVGGFTPPGDKIKQNGVPAQSSIAWGIGDVAQEQLGAHCDEFCGMRHNKRPPKRRESPGQ
ncbi:hypothetical protein BACCAP_00573 [Pseudoflavonifractor capillosus ATCC 29799]|uniref:Uncharacterized protein n=1 Tax=Pseudoflavonifractor capillosus ATCC 29799 TaxID=411467 RepID=A6NQU9_9FIRM|nr:hypothetical protein BACCAP_00573 [Pseudoflavonifractor capillosus ATCC 29799]